MHHCHEKTFCNANKHQRKHFNYVKDTFLKKLENRSENNIYGYNLKCET